MTITEYENDCLSNIDDLDTIMLKPNLGQRRVKSAVKTAHSQPL